MARGKSKQQSAAADADQAAVLPKGAVVDALDDRVYVPVDTGSSDGEAAVQSTDTVAEVLAGNYSEGIVDEVIVTVGPATAPCFAGWLVQALSFSVCSVADALR